MAPIDFPSSGLSPNVTTYTVNGRTWLWDGTSWRGRTAGYAGSIGAQGPQGPQGYTGSNGTNASVTTSVSAPGSPLDGDLWWSEEEGQLKIYYNDGTSSQWVDASAGMKGDIGYTGSIGTQGPQGPQGPQGYTGSVGAGSTYSALVGDGTNTVYTITHNLAATSVLAQLVRVSTGEFVYPDISVVNTNSLTVTFTTAPTSNQYRINVIGF